LKPLQTKVDGVMHRDTYDDFSAVRKGNTIKIYNMEDGKWFEFHKVDITDLPPALQDRPLDVQAWLYGWYKGIGRA
jgi:hypothetical protein